MFNKILLAYDGSEGAKLALNRTVELAKKFGSKVFLLAVGRIPEYSQSKVEFDEAKEQANNFYLPILKDAQNLLNQNKIDNEILIYYGKPSEVIIKVAENLEVDLIVLGSRKHHPIFRRILGATADKVVDNANCSVLVFK